MTLTAVGEEEERREYDNMSRLIAETRGNGETAQYRYDLAGNAVWIKDSYGETVNEFDANGNVIAVKDAKTGKVRFRYEYDALGQMTAMIFDDGSMFCYEYDALGERIGSEYVEPGRQPHGTSAKSHYRPINAIQPEIIDESYKAFWSNRNTLSEANALLRQANAGLKEAEAAYLAARADAPGTAAARNAEAAYNRARQAASNAKAARDAVSGATDKATADSALSRARYAASDAQMAAEDAAMWAEQAERIKRAKAAKAKQAATTQGITTDSPTVDSPVEESYSCGKERYWHIDTDIELVLYSILTIGLDVVFFAATVVIIIASVSTAPLTAGASIAIGMAASETLAIAGINLAYDTASVIGNIEKYNRGEKIDIDLLGFLFPSFLIGNYSVPQQNRGQEVSVRQSAMLRNE